MSSTPSRKELGAYYTDTTVASFLVRWAVVTGQEVVLDPGHGDGVFLAAAAERLRGLGGDSRDQVYGVEVDAATHRRFALRSEIARTPVRLIHASFFDLSTDDLPAADAVVGNPPFIRYQRFNGETRQRALWRAREVGVPLSQLTSAWAPFLVHAVRFVKPGGRLAMVVPAELAHAGYARPVLDYLRRSFRTLRILSFSRKLFPDLSEDTVLLLAAERGEPFDNLTLIDLPDPEALVRYREPTGDLPPGVPVDASAVGQGVERLLHYLLPRRTRELYQELRASPGIVELGSLAQVGIGYVTGDNDFFHLNRATVEAFGVPAEFVRPAVRNGSQLAGLSFTREDWEALDRFGHANLLLHIPEGERLPDSLQRYLLQGVRRGVPNRYKCRVRKPWYRVPHVYEADGFLTYMSGSEPRLVANEAGAVAPNTLHIVRLQPTCPTDCQSLAAAWQTSLTALSWELEGHSLGGGMLKLEPTEARRVAIPLPKPRSDLPAGLPHELDSLLRNINIDAARELADQVLLHDGLGITLEDIRELREGWLTLRARRLNR